MLAVILAAALGTWGPAGALHLRGDVRAAQTARSLDMVETDDVARAELTIVPELALLTEGRLQLRLAYAPSLLVPADLAGNTEGLDGSLAERSVVLHRITGGGELGLSTWRLRAGGAVATGETLLIGEPTVGAAPGQPVSTTAQVPYFGAEATVGATTEITQRTTVSFFSTYGESGGTGDEGRAQLPVLQGVSIGATAGYELAPLHVIGVDVLANRSRVGEEAAGDAGYVRGGGRWAWQMAPQTALRTALGLAFTYDRLTDADSPELADAPSVLPWIEGAIDHVQDGVRPAYGLALALEPVVDRFSGALDLRSNVVGTVGWAPWRRWNFGLRASSTALFGWTGERPGVEGTGDAHTLVHGAAVTAGHELAEGLRLGASAGSTWQDTDRTDLPSFREDLVVLELTASLFAL